MRKSTTLFILFIAIFCNTLFAQIDSTAVRIAEFEASLEYQTGTIDFPSCSAKMVVPNGFKYLDAEQAIYVLSDVWGNPRDTTILGLLVPEGKGVLGAHSWVFTLTFDPIGYVKDDDAEDIDYEELLEQMQTETKEANPNRVQLGYPAIEIIGWASKPYYDKDKKVLHWAKEAKFGGDSINTLNYNLRILGKDGVFVVNAIASIEELNEVKPTIDNVLASIEFEKGNTYFDFNPDVDNVAAYTVGGLVAGKVLAKVGFFAIIAKFGKIILLGLIAGFGALWSFITGKKKKEAVQEEPVQEEKMIENE